MRILFLHGWTSTPGGVKPTYLKNRGHTVLNPALPDEDFEAAVRIAQGEFDQHHPDVVVGSSRGGAVAMNIDTGTTPLVLLCPAWKRWGTATLVKPGTVILHSRADDVVPFADTLELLRNSSLDESALIVVGNDHRLADPESLAMMAMTVAALQSETAASGQRQRHFDVSEEVRRDAARTETVVCRKLLEIMDLQADIDALLRDSHPTPFGSARWKNARPETLQRLVAMTAIQFLLFEPVDWVAGNEDLKPVAENLLRMMSIQVKSLGDRPAKA
jgi:hypothetical protein